MLETRFRRGVALAVVVGVVSLVGLVLQLTTRTYDEQRDDFVEEAREQFAGTTTAEATELFMDEIIESSTGRSASLDELLTVDGREPERVQELQPRGLEAVYRIDAWDDEGLVVVRWDEEGLEIDAD